MIDLAHLLLDGLVVGVAVWCVAMGLHLSRLAIGGYHLELCGWAIVPFVVADEMILRTASWSGSFFPLFAVLAGLLSAIPFFAFARFVTKPLWVRTQNGAAVLVATFAGFQLLLDIVKRVFSSAAVRMTIGEEFLGPQQAFSNYHLIAAGVIVLLVGAWWSIRRMNLAAPILMLENDRDQLLLLGLRPERYARVALAMALTASMVGGFVFSLIQQPLAITSSYQLLLLSFACTIFFPRRNKVLPIVVAIAVGLALSLSPLVLSGRYIVALLGGMMIAAAAINTARNYFLQASGGLRA